jgi:carbonic anhydrase
MKIPVLPIGKLQLTLDNLKKVTTYVGSLTTPPCTEGVRWLIADKELKISKSDAEHLKSLLPKGGNARPLQVIGQTSVETAALKKA